LNKKKATIATILIAVGAVMTLVIVAVIVGFFSGTGFTLASGTVWIIWLVALAVIGILIWANQRYNVGRRALKVNEGEDAKWLTKSMISKNDSLTVTKLSKLGNIADGIPIHAQKRGKDISIILCKPIHTLVIGTTGSGKTTTFIEPCIEIMARCKTKPCMVITDPKGELYLHHSESLRKLGYETLVIDLNDIYRSTNWNPFNDIYLKTERMHNAKVECRSGKYYFDGREYLAFEDADADRKVFAKSIKDDIFIDIQDLIYTICPVENTNDSTWQKGARDLILALAVAFWEDMRDGLMERKQFNLFNLYTAISKYAKGNCEELKAYFDNRDEFSQTKGLANTVLVSQDRTLSSYLGDVNQYFSWMADTGISALTSSNGIEFSTFDEKPTALFLKIPDERENRHRLVTLFITQMYKALVAKADENQKKGKTQSAELLRNTYFMMDEFGNMPKFHKIDNIITVGRSRKIWMIPVIQDFKQLDNKYGKEIAAIIKSNCAIKVFIQAGDNETNEEFSKLCGKHKIKNISYSQSERGQGMGRSEDNLTISTSVQEKPLIHPSELAMLNDASAGLMGNAIVLALGKNPYRAKFTPVFKCKEIYGCDKNNNDPPREPTIFDEKDVYYEIVHRNAFVKMDKELDENEDDQASDRPLADTGEQVSDGVHDRLTKIVTQLFIDLRDDIIRKFEGRLDEATLKELIEADFENKIALLDKLMDAAYTKDDKWLLTDLAFMKSNIKTNYISA